MVVPPELLRDPHHLQALERDPRRGVGLLQAPALGHRLRPVEDPDVVHPEEAALEQVGPLGVLAVHPPGEVEQQLGEDPDEEVPVPGAVAQVDLPRGPRVHGRVDVGERPLVGGQLAVRMLGPFPAEQQQLRLREGRVDVRQGDGVEGEVPGREPGVLPLVRHRDDVGEGDVAPRGVPAVGLGRQPLRRRGWGVRVALEPLLDVVAVQLSGPQQPGERAAGGQTVLGGHTRRDHQVVEGVRVGVAVRDDSVGRGRRAGRPAARRPAGAAP